MDPWLKDVVLPLLIAISATAIGSGSIFLLCHFLYKRMMEGRRRHAREAAPGARTSGADSGGEPLPQADTAHDVELGLLNGGEVGEPANLLHSSSPGNGNAA